LDFLIDFSTRFILQFQSPALAFLLGGMILAACGSKLQIPNAIYQFIVFMLLLSRLPNVKKADGIATAGLFGAVSASTLAAAMVLLEEEGLLYEAWAPALYPFMDIPALILAIVMAQFALSKKEGKSASSVKVWPIVKESLQSSALSALSALLLGMALGLFTKPDNVFETFYDPLFRGFLSVLMLAMGIEAYTRLNELRRVTLGKSIGLYWLIHQCGYAGGHLDLYSLIYRYGASIVLKTCAGFSG